MELLGSNIKKNQETETVKKLLTFREIELLLHLEKLYFRKQKL